MAPMDFDSDDASTLFYSFTVSNTSSNAKSYTLESTSSSTMWTILVSILVLIAIILLLAMLVYYRKQKPVVSKDQLKSSSRSGATQTSTSGTSELSAQIKDPTTKPKVVQYGTYEKLWTIYVRLDVKIVEDLIMVRVDPNGRLDFVFEKVRERLASMDVSVSGDLKLFKSKNVSSRVYPNQHIISSGISDGKVLFGKFSTKKQERGHTGVRKEEEELEEVGNESYVITKTKCNLKFAQNLDHEKEESDKSD